MGDLLQLTVWNIRHGLKITVTNDSKALLTSRDNRFSPHTSWTKGKKAPRVLETYETASDIVKGPQLVLRQGPSTTRPRHGSTTIIAQTREKKPGPGPVDAFSFQYPTQTSGARQDIQLGYNYTYQTDDPSQTD